jgi:hypothetical protein
VSESSKIEAAHCGALCAGGVIIVSPALPAENWPWFRMSRFSKVVATFSECRAFERSSTENSALQKRDPRSVKSRISQHRCALGSCLNLAALNNIKLRQHQLAIAKPRMF